MTTVVDAVADLTRDFSAVGIESPRLDARILIGHVLGLEPGMLFARSQVQIGAPEMAAILELARRRAAHEPVSRIIGRREFFGLDFKVTPDTLDPRPDTEAVIAAVLDCRALFAGPRILDLGTGTGCILLAILSAWSDASGLGVDMSPAAVTVATENATRLGLATRARFKTGDWGEGLSETFDVIVSNPPYIADGEIEGLAPDVRLFDPALALRGGADGLACYRALLPAARRLLARGGRLFLEIGATQAAAVTALLQDTGLRLVAEQRDLGGIIRCLVAAAA